MNESPYSKLITVKKLNCYIILQIMLIKKKVHEQNGPNEANTPEEVSKSNKNSSLPKTQWRRQGGGVLWVLEHPPPPETYLLFSDVFAVSTPFVLDLDKD